MRRLIVLPLLAAALVTTSCGLTKPATKEYAYPDWGFKVSFEAPPQVTNKPETAQEPRSLVLETDTGGRDFAVDANDAPNVTDIDQLTDAAIPFMLQDVKGGQVGTRTYVATFEGLMGRQLDITAPGQPTIRVRIFLAGGRAYTLVAKSAFGAEDPAVSDFLYSFHVLPGTPPVVSNATPGPRDHAVEDALKAQAEAAANKTAP